MPELRKLRTVRDAQSIAKLLNRVDYPMIERRYGFPLWVTLVEVGVIEWPTEDLPPPSLEGGEPHTGRRSRRARVAGFAVALLLPGAAVAVLAALAVGWPIVVSIIGLTVAFLAIALVRETR